MVLPGRFKRLICSGNPATRNDGKSEIFNFYLKKQDSTKIDIIASEISNAINKLKIKFEDSTEFNKVLSEMESNSKKIINNINSPDTDYLKSLSENAGGLLKASGMDYTQALSLARDTNKDFEVKEKTDQQSNSSPEAFQKIKLKILLVESNKSGGINDAEGAYVIKVNKWAFRQKNEADL